MSTDNASSMPMESLESTPRANAVVAAAAVSTSSRQAARPLNGPWRRPARSLYTPEQSATYRNNPNASHSGADRFSRRLLAGRRHVFVPPSNGYRLGGSIGNARAHSAILASPLHRRPMTHPTSDTMTIDRHNTTISPSPPHSPPLQNQVNSATATATIAAISAAAASAAATAMQLATTTHPTSATGGSSSIIGTATATTYPTPFQNRTNTLYSGGNSSRSSSINAALYHQDEDSSYSSFGNTSSTTAGAVVAYLPASTIRGRDGAGAVGEQNQAPVASVTAATAAAATAAAATVKNDCCICLSSPIASPTQLSGCDHSSFCYDCIVTWAAMENSCPLCKKRFTWIRRITGEDSNTTSTGTGPMEQVAT